MNKSLLFYLLPLILILFSCGKSSEEYVKMADKAFDSGDKEKAQILYLKAASMNNADAHFALAYKYILSDEKSIYHFTEAAKLGHQQALVYALDDLLFRANSLTETNATKAYEIYLTAKKTNPQIKLFEEETVVNTIKMCMEAEPFDAIEFVKKYEINVHELDDSYSIWELAEEASRGGRFGKPNPKLVFQLVSRGGSVPAEFESAVESTYNNWKKNKVSEFDICNHITSGYGLSYCSARNEEIANKEYVERIKQLSSKLKNNTGVILLSTFNVASKFIEEKAWKEELHGGSGFAAWTRESIMDQKEDYLHLVEKINKSNYNPTKAIGDSDKVLNEVYQSVLDTLNKSPISELNNEVTAEGIRSVQKLWIKYRDSSAILFSQLNPSIKKEQWINWLTTVRISELRLVLEKSENSK